MLCSVVIPTRYRPKLLSTVLDALSIQREEDFEVIVVCDGEDPSTRNLAELYKPKFPLKWIFKMENKGLPAARNSGAEAAKGDLLLFLDDDTCPVPEWISEHKKSHEIGGNNGNLVICGRIIHLYLREARSHTERFLGISRERFEVDFEAKMISGGIALIGAEADRYRYFGVNCSISRATFLRFGGFDEALRHLDEERELGVRLNDNGIQFKLERSAVVHHYDSKKLDDYHVSCWKRVARVDLYRVAAKQQRNGQTRGLIAVRRRDPLGRLKMRVFWQHADCIRILAEMFRKATDATGSKLFFLPWSYLAQSAGYWGGVRSAGFTIESLRQLVGTPLVVLAFHGVSESDLPRKDIFPPRKFLRLARWLKNHRYKQVDVEEGFSETYPQRKVLITFDDGHEDFYFEVFPHIGHFGIKPIVFLVSDAIGRVSTWNQYLGYEPRRLLSISQIREMHRHGVQFGSHSASHSSLPELSDERLQEEVCGSKSYLEDMLGAEVTSFSYPWGAVDARVRGAVAQAGYKFAFCKQQGINHWDDRLSLKRIEVNNCGSFVSLAVKIMTGRSPKQNMLLPIRFARRIGVHLLH